MTRQDSPPPSALDGAIASLQSAVGQRVRQERARLGISRRILSERSGVSPRYLAQLESGTGNISIGLLLRVADALDQPIAALLADLSADAMDVAHGFAKADAPTQMHIRSLLDGGQKAGRICLIGLRGAGKSTLGAAIGAALDLPFVELNREIESEGGMPLGEIIALYGSDGYRKLEADVLSRIEARHDRAIVAVAGGIVGEPEIFDRLLQRFHTIWLKASPDEHMARVLAQGDTRPVEGNPQAMAQLQRLLATREVHYARADAVLDTSGITVDVARDTLLRLIEDRGFLTNPFQPSEGI